MARLRGQPHGPRRPLQVHEEEESRFAVGSVLVRLGAKERGARPRQERRELYKKGLEKGALPVEMLTAKQAAFEARAVDRERNPPPPRPRPRGLTAQRPSRAPTQQPQSAPAGGGAPALEIFVDEGLRPVTAPSTTGPTSVAPRVSPRRRRDVLRAGPSASAPRRTRAARRPGPRRRCLRPCRRLRRRPRRASAAPPAFDVFVDDDCVRHGAGAGRADDAPRPRYCRYLHCTIPTAPQRFMLIHKPRARAGSSSSSEGFPGRSRAAATTSSTTPNPSPPRP